MAAQHGYSTELQPIEARQFAEKVNVHQSDSTSAPKKHYRESALSPRSLTPEFEGETCLSPPRPRM